MRNFKSFLGAAGILVAATLGAGIFSLPYVFKSAGWPAGIFYLAALSAIIIFAHYLYWQVLHKVHERQRLLGLAKSYLGRNFFALSFLSIIGGLLLTLVIYLILGAQFIKLLAPGVNWISGLLIFWFAGSLPLIFKSLRLSGVELLGTVLMAAIIVLIFATASQYALPSSASFDLKNIFLPFGAILFSLAGWTAVEPMFDYVKSFPVPRSEHGRNFPLAALTAGTLATALLYLLFVLGIFGSAAAITKDMVSGLTNWPHWKLNALGSLGLLAVWTSYVPIGLEIKNTLEKDLRARDATALSAVVFAPIFLVILGFNDFLSVLGLAGGVFLSLQYLLIILVAKKVLVLRGFKKLLADLSLLVFLLAAVYEIYYFLL